MKPLNTLIVEDNALLCQSLAAALEELSPVRVVATADDEDAAVRWMKANQGGFDLAIIDIFLRQGSGLGVLREARSVHASAALVVVSNYATPDVRRRCAELGAQRVFDKSSEIEELVDYCIGLADESPRGAGRQSGAT